MTTTTLEPPADDEPTPTGDLDLLADEFGIYTLSKGLAPPTRRDYDESARRFVAWCRAGNAPVFAAELTRRNLSGYFAWMSEQTKKDGEAVTKSTVATQFRRLQQFFRWMLDDDVLQVSPMQGLKAPKPQEVPVPVVSIEAMRAMLAVCDPKTFLGIRDEAILRLFVDAGPRLSELAGIKMADFDLKTFTVRVTGKGDKVRDLPISPKTAKALAKYIRVRASQSHSSLPWLWIGKRGQFKRAGIDTMIERRAIDAGIGQMNAHRFRHTFAHMFRAGGGQAHELMKLCGWTSEAMARRYGASAIAEEARATHRRIAPGDMF